MTRADERSTSSSREWAAVSLPIALGVIVGGTYLLGAIELNGQLMDIGLGSTDVLPVVPLDQHLGRGLATLLNPFALIVAVVVAIQMFEDQDDKGPIWESLPEKHQGKGRVASRVGVVLVALLILFGASLGTIVSVAIAAGLSFFAISLAYRRPGYLQGRSRAVKDVAFGGILVFFYLTYAVALAYLDPEPLSSATICTQAGEQIEGPLVASTDTRWFVGGDERGEMRVIASREIVGEVEIRPSLDSGGPSLAQVLGDYEDPKRLTKVTPCPPRLASTRSHP